MSNNLADIDAKRNIPVLSLAPIMRPRLETMHCLAEAKYIIDNMDVYFEQ